MDLFHLEDLGLGDTIQLFFMWGAHIIIFFQANCTPGGISFFKHFFFFSFSTQGILAAFFIPSLQIIITIVNTFFMSPRDNRPTSGQELQGY